MGIKVNTYQLQSKSTQANAIASQLSEKAYHVNGLYYSLDPKVKNRQGIGTSLYSLQHRIENAKQKMYNIGGFLTNAAEQYNMAEAIIAARTINHSAIASRRVGAIGGSGVGSFSRKEKVGGIGKGASVGVATGAVKNIKEEWDRKKLEKLYNENMGTAGTGNRVTKEQLQKIYTNTTVTDEMVSDLNRVLEKYGITDVENIQHFIAQTCIETGYGKSVVELGSDKYLNSKPYGKKYSGVGYIQMTWDYGYAAFATYMILEQYPDLKSVATYKNPKNNNRETIFNAYNKIVAAAKDKGYNIEKFTDIVDKGRDYVKDNYAWETAGYFWNINGLTSANKNSPVDDVTKVVNKWTDSYADRRTAYNKVIEVIK